MSEDNEEWYFKKAYENTWEKTNGIEEVNEKIEYNSNVNVTALEYSMNNEEMNTKGNKNWGEKLKKLHWKGLCLQCEALELFKNHGQVIELKVLNGDLGRKSYLNM